MDRGRRKDVIVPGAEQPGATSIWSETSKHKGELQRAGVMAAATFIGSFLPAAPFLFFVKPVALVVAFVLVLAAAVIYPKKLAVSQKTCHAARRFQRMGFLS